MSRLSHLTLTDRALVSVTGEDWRSFLQGLLTQDVETLSQGELRYGALLTPQGRLLVDLFILGAEGGALLDVAADRRDDLIRRLTMYRLRAKAQIAPREGRPAVAFGEGDPGPGWIADPRLPALGWRCYEPTGDDATAGEWIDRRMALAVPDMADFGEDKTYPIEANLDLLNAIDFKKGCFVGQETTSRMKRRGQVKSRMLPLRVEGATAGAEVLNGELRAGVVTSAGEGLALGLMRLDRIDGALTVDGRPAAVEPPDWIKRAI
ncbi:folate-binding protein [Caulobacter sp. SLTY]|uniref:CAF17-like 4Fe-4S cluster assembly/insertion protein YgfZ n=1 Tax=Caulobacter sp. SLTY TaxID=2683262 RepID=UPI001411FE1B|nr:folate-binding protein YgfZ [Caulobacter sp. SLTY]NBB14461.1 folate-binding protein [Caulobacter sp. SLTY]